MHLHMPDGFAEMRPGVSFDTQRTHSQQRDLILEANHTLDDYTALIYPAAARGIIPCGIYFFRRIHLRLPLAGRRHHRLDDAGITDRFNRCAHFLQAVGKTVGRRRQAQRFCGKTAYTFAVHGQHGRARGGDHPRQPRALDQRQHVGGDGLDFRHDQIRLFLLDQGTQRCSIRHVDHMRTMSELVSWCIGVTVHRNGFDA